MEKKSFWLSIELWNLNEVFTTESISPISFYLKRNFGNPVNRNHERIEDENNLILFDAAVQSEILLNISNELLDLECLTVIKTDKKVKIKSFEYPKTIYLKKDLIKVFFCNYEKLKEFLNNTLLLLEVKTVNKYKSDFHVVESTNQKRQIGFYQSQFLAQKDEFQPFNDKAYNQIKGLIYGYLIGSIGTLGDKEQILISDLLKLKNAIGSIHTDIVLSEHYSNIWLINCLKQIQGCSNLYFKIFSKDSDVFDTLTLRLEEVDKLNQLRCEELEKQKTPKYRGDFEKVQENLEYAKRKLYQYECKQEIIPLKEELASIRREEVHKGKSKGKTREYYKKDTLKFNRKLELKQLIAKYENDIEYIGLKKEVAILEENLQHYQFGFSQYDTSLTEQFSRISDYLNDLIKRATSYFLSKNNNVDNFPDISFEVNKHQLAEYYSLDNTDYTDLNIKLPNALLAILSEPEVHLIKISINSILSHPQGRLGNYSEKSILDIIVSIGQKLADGMEKNYLREYYRYRKGETDNFNFPKNSTVANLIVFFMKLNGHEQINKMLISKNISHKQIAFMFYGAFVGFANMPKTFTNLIFESNNLELCNYIDNYLFNNYLKKRT